ncbi:MAG: hypothetical protein K6F51_12875 [Acetatifactor sp.]|nr:hypothetical protein [Acetatifactor sp.]
MDNGFELLTEKETMWAEMLGQVLKDNDVPYVAIPVNGTGLSLKTGLQDRLRIYVPADKKRQADSLLNELFPEE